MKRIAPIAIAAGTLLASLALAAPAEAHGRNGHHRHRVEQRHDRHHERHRKHVKHDRRHYRESHDRRAYRHDRRHERRYEQRYERGHRYERRHRYDEYDRFVIPRRIHRERARHYDPYYEGSVFYAPHRHRHAVFNFPVWIDDGWSHRRHFYCEGSLYDGHHGRIDFNGRRFSVSLGF